MKTSELTGAALDWAVARALGKRPSLFIYEQTGKLAPEHNYSTDWSQGGPIIEREGIHPTVEYSSDVFGEPIARCGWRACAWNASTPGTSGFMVWGLGETLLVAAMRCFVASRLGDEVDVPEELI